MSDRELLEMAAKAAGVEYDPKQFSQFGLWLVIHGEPSEYQRRYWNPLTDDGDALRLAVKLDLMWNPRFVHERDVLMFTQNTPKLEATRHAIVRAAAEIGKAIK